MKYLLVKSVYKMFTRSFLVCIRRKALRHGVLFKALDQIERGLLNLSILVLDRVESVLLGIELLKIVSKLRDAMKSCFVRHLEEYGFSRLRTVVAQALSFKCVAAPAWSKDLNFARYLTLIDLNKPTGFGV